MTIKGYPSGTNTGAPSYATVSPVREQQAGVDVVAHVFFQSIGTDAAEAASTTTSIVATAHAAKKGDVISWTAGNLNTKEYRVSAVSANAITVAEAMSEAPGVGDTFAILRQKAPTVSSSGALGVSLTTDQGAGATTATTMRVVIATDQTSIPVTDNGGTLSIDDGGGSLTVDGSVTVSATNLDIRDLSSASDSVACVQSGAWTATVSATNLDIRDLTSAADSVAAVQSGTWNIGDITGAVSLPTGAATAAKQDTGNTSLASVDTKLANGTGTAAGAVRVVLASDSPTVKGRSKVSLVSQDLSSVTTAAYVELVAATSADINWISAFDSGGEGVILATGAAAAEVDQLYIPPGGFGHPVELYIASGTRLSVKTLLGNPTSGRLVMNLYS